MSDEATLTLPQRLTEADAALRLGISVWSLRRLERAGEIRAFRPTSRKIFYFVDDLAAFVERRRATRPCPPAAA